MGSSIMTMIMLLIIIMISPSSSSPTFLYHFCSNSSTYDSNSSFPTNLNTLLTYLTSNASTSPTGFYSTSVGRAANDTVYGFFMCRGDQNTSACSDCVATAVDHTQTSTCMRSKEHVIFYDECMLRYDDQALAGRLDKNGDTEIWFNADNITGINRTESERLAQSTLNMLIQAPNRNDKKYAATATYFSSSNQTLYVSEQCVPDLTDNDCYQCLHTAIQQLITRSQGGRVFSGSCNVRFETYYFFNGAVNFSSAPPTMVNITPPTTGQTKDGSYHEKAPTGIVLAIVAPVATILGVLLIVGSCLIKINSRKSNTGKRILSQMDQIKSLESLQFDLNTIRTATRNFFIKNKLGEGGFGGVYKGKLENGQEIAVKRLSETSGQGVAEFKTEVVLVAKLQHKNLVKLLGFCLDLEEKLLIYEYLPNSSLDKFIFDPLISKTFDWQTRLKITNGVARGLLYLHEDSRLKVIHRDLKTSNILLDQDMNPKISDFGLAKLLGVDQTQGDTNKIVGTYGYMAPEYAITGHYSVKSDVYSFGVIVLEIVSGQRSRFLTRLQPNDEALLHRAWRLWYEGKPLDFVDRVMNDNFLTEEVMKCIHIGLLCIQENAAQRPTMTSIVAAFSGQSINLPMPKPPHFFGNTNVNVIESDHATDENDNVPWVYSGTNTISQLYPRE